MTPIPCLLGPSRQAPYQITDRLLPPEGVIIPRPFDIQHQLRAPTGRSSGGAYMLGCIERMTWVYRIGQTALYTQLMNCYSPAHPWVWVYYLDPIVGPGWVEACMQEPSLSRGMGNTVQDILLVFHTVQRYVGPN